MVIQHSDDQLEVPEYVEQEKEHKIPLKIFKKSKIKQFFAAICLQEFGDLLELLVVLGGGNVLGTDPGIGGPIPEGGGLLADDQDAVQQQKGMATDVEAWKGELF